MIYSINIFKANKNKIIIKNKKAKRTKKANIYNNCKDIQLLSGAFCD